MHGNDSRSESDQPTSLCSSLQFCSALLYPSPREWRPDLLHLCLWRRREREQPQQWCEKQQKKIKEKRWSKLNLEDLLFHHNHQPSLLKVTIGPFLFFFLFIFLFIFLFFNFKILLMIYSLHRSRLKNKVFSLIYSIRNAIYTLNFTILNIYSLKITIKF
jgi:hypothetical protein